MRRALLLATLLLGAAGCHAPPAVVAARQAVRDVVAGDTANDAAPATAEDSARIVALVRRYLRVRPAGMAPSPFWRREEQRRFPWYDLVGVETYRFPSFRARYRLDVALGAPPAEAEPGTVEARLGFVPKNPEADPPIAVRLYARRDGGSWRLGGALPQLTRAWPERRVGRIRFRVQPGATLDSALAAGGAAFVDSLAAAFEVEPPAEVLYVLARSEQDGLRILGIDTPGFPFGFFHWSRNRLVVSAGAGGTSRLRHELTHAALEGVGDPERRHRAAVEGVAEWMAWRARPVEELLGRQLVRRARLRRPELALLDVVAQRLHDGGGDADAEQVFDATSAWMAGVVHGHSGAAGVKELLQVRDRKPEEFMAVVQRRAGLSRKELEGAWEQWMVERGPSVVAP